ncbi:MAG: hypothetical protein UR54_C0005G0008 [Candidatus Roizmanbacteria bacterium GW2011_GWA2_34_18]|uniref:DUF4446 domain-containing protein n=1 Tax=Candidatus Roizmanbacteria bacterium GW2011_GWA2_34_18 TaxID=1618477 RepID=A0A0G0BBL1_9BACT|nr:MAG: hypothetical protein UR54_C0005G0008 [Candidatus Roizmanbacteria bacterium GW2011_GWA2_34_18]
MTVFVEDDRMYLMVIYIIGAIFFIWLVFLTGIVLKTKAHYNNLISKTRKQKIDEILDELLMIDKKTGQELEIVKKELHGEIKTSTLHIQKIGLVRFNPFERSGGEKSFVISFLNNENSGIVINFIYTRDGLRVYSKKVKDGKGEEYNLSEEEEKAIEKSN